MDPQPSDLERSVLKTVLWFSLFSQALTAFEIWKWLMAPARGYDLCEVELILARSPWLKEKLQASHGFYALKGAQDIAALMRLRQERFVDAERKFKRLRRAARFFRALPGVRAVAAVNSLAWFATGRESDIDVYVVVRPGLIWSSRFWLVLPCALVGARPMREHEESEPARDPFCFSFFSTSDALPMEDLCLPRDIYMAFWVKSLVPVFDRDECFSEFERANRWATTLLPNARARRPHHAHTPGVFPFMPIQTRLTEPLFRTFQRARLPAHLRELANQDSRVIVREDRLKFHDNDRRAEFRDRFEALMAQHL
ncbi:hypothetical protein HY631_01125 [Candidatus Uhrbacteria bacterium]|nr:hypothetical protein [Candidatus Uhrbacteria bacterium]